MLRRPTLNVVYQLFHVFEFRLTWFLHDLVGLQWLPYQILCFIFVDYGGAFIMPSWRFNLISLSEYAVGYRTCFFTVRLG